MKILFVVRWFPHPPDNGSKIRIFNIVERLSTSHDICLAALTDDEIGFDRVSELKNICKEVYTVRRQPFDPLKARALAGFLSASPRYLFATHSPEMKNMVERLQRSWRPDVVVASQIDSISHVKDLHGVPKVLDELELQVTYDRFIDAHSRISRWRHGLTWWKLSRFVGHMLKGFDGCTVSSELEKKLLLRAVPGFDRCTVVPNAAEEPGDAFTKLSPTPFSLIYPGALTFSANLDAMTYFLDDIYPRILGKCPRSRLTITGRYDNVPLTSLRLNRRVRLSGYINDIRQAIAKSWATVVPLRIGGGTRLKILESMSVGTPVISTPKGAQGLGVTHGENILIADTPGGFAHSIMQLFEDESLRRRLSDKGKRLVAERYSWKASVGLLETMIQNAAAGMNP